jgi:Uma2 family endonuclease
MALALRKKRFTADEYQRMGQVGILSEDDRVELIDGEIVAKMTIGPKHNACVASGTRAFVEAAGHEAIVLPQGSVRLDLYNEPEPDLVLLKPRSDFYASKHASPEDILLIVEIAESSLEIDRDLKARIYARSRVPEYWIVNLKFNLITRYSSPQQGVFRDVTEARRGESIAPALLPTCVVLVDALLIE